MSDRAQLLGAVLAGGRGRRLGGAKATVRLDGRPLIAYPLEAVFRGLGNVAVVAKSTTDLPPLEGIPVWLEPGEPHHPLAGVVHALRMAEGRSVLVCACDLPLVTPQLVRDVAGTDARRAPAVIACADGCPQPLLGCYRPEALPALAAALDAPGARLTDVVSGLGSQLHEVPDPRLLFNVNTPEDLLQASALRALLRQRPATRDRDQPNVKS